MLVGTLLHLVLLFSVSDDAHCLFVIWIQGSDAHCFRSLLGG